MDFTVSEEKRTLIPGRELNTTYGIIQNLAREDIKNVDVEKVVNGGLEDETRRLWEFFSRGLFGESSFLLLRESPQVCYRGKVQYGGQLEPTFDLYFERSKSPEIDPEINMRVNSEGISLRLAFGSPEVIDSPLEDLLRLCSSLTGHYSIYGISERSTPMLSVVPVAQGVQFLQDAKRIYSKMYDAEGHELEWTRRLLDLREQVKNPQIPALVRERARDVYAAELLNFSGVNLNRE